MPTTVPPKTLFFCLPACIAICNCTFLWVLNCTPCIKFHIAWGSDYVHLVYHCWDTNPVRCCELSSLQTSGIYFELLLPRSSGQRKEGVHPQLTGEWAAHRDSHQTGAAGLRHLQQHPGDPAANRLKAEFPSSPNPGAKFSLDGVGVGTLVGRARQDSRMDKLRFAKEESRYQNERSRTAVIHIHYLRV